MLRRLLTCALLLRQPRCSGSSWPAIPSDVHVENEFQLLQPENIVSIRGEVAGDYAISVFPTLIADDDYVYISFSAAQPSYKDWIAAYAPVPANDSMLSLTVPIKYAWCDWDPDYLTTGNGTLRFQLTAAYRSSVAFYYFTNQTFRPALVASAAEVVQFTADALMAPLLPRVMPTGDPAFPLRIMWGSLNATTPAVQVLAQSRACS
jgi:hypothetical protein